MLTRKLQGALRDPWLSASRTGLLALVTLALVYGRDAGITYDEGFQAQYGERVLSWFRSGFRDRAAFDYLDLYLYGGLFDAISQLVMEQAPFEPFETKHLLTALTAVLAIAGTWQLAAAVGGRRAGFFAAATLALSPTFIGHGLFNPKDIPFAAAAVFSLVGAQRLALGPLPFRVRDVVCVGLALGAALGVRPGGVFLVCYPLAAAVGRVALEWRMAADQPLVRVAVQNLPRLCLGFAIAWLVMLLAWPWAQLAPLTRPLEAMLAASRFNWLGDVLFAGQQVSSVQLPASYLWVWFGITLPELYLVAFLGGVVAVAVSGEGLDRAAPAGGLLVLAVALPLLAATLTRPVLYDAHRHFLFVFPPLAALAGCGISAFIAQLKIPRAVRAVGLAAWSASALWVMADIVALHPYQYVYFNRSVGGLPGAVDRFETDYWGASYREGLEWLVDHTLPRAQPLRIAACDHNALERLHYYLQRWRLRTSFQLVNSAAEADVFIAVTRHDCHRRVNGEILHVVRRQGAPLLYVLRMLSRRS